MRDLNQDVPNTRLVLMLTLLLYWCCVLLTLCWLIVLTDEMGLGKTIQCIALLAFLALQRGVTGPFLVVAPLSTVASWQRECEKWAAFLNTVVYSGSKRSREIIREFEFYTQEKTKGGRGVKATTKTQTKFNILITTYEYVLADRVHLNKIPWQYLMVDEGPATTTTQARAWINTARATNSHLTLSPPLLSCLAALLVSVISSSSEGFVVSALPSLV
jgi:chromodomain-helicase-DNA-binding protein 1